MSELNKISARRTAKDGNGATIRVGDWVEFKSDIEQSAQIHDIKSSRFHGKMIILKRPEGGWSGDYLQNDPDFYDEEAGRVYKF